MFRYLMHAKSFRRIHLRSYSLLTILLVSLSTGAQTTPAGRTPVRVAIVGLVHSHVAGFLPQLAQHPEVQLVGIQEADPALAAKYESRFHLDPALVYASLETMIAKMHPQALLVYTATSDHRRIIEAAAAHGISVMVEKPLAISLEDALAIRRAATRQGIHVLVNYETTWYASNQDAYKELNEGKLGELRKVIVRDGHEGPKEIHVGPEFADWLTDPARNGAGALYDFGCYGADLMTWLMHGQTPISVTAVTQTDKPAVYPRVDDDSTIIVRYPTTQAVIMGSWDWSFAVKNMELYGTGGTLFTDGPKGIITRSTGQKQSAVAEAPALDPAQSGSLAYLVAVMNGQLPARGDLSALDTNVIVMQILDAARTAARTGQTVSLKPLPAN